MMKVILYQTKRTQTGMQGRSRTKHEWMETDVFEDLGTDADCGRTIATFRRHEEAEEYCVLKGYEITQNSKIEGI